MWGTRGRNEYGKNREGNKMETATIFGVALAALFFSLACALLLEELIFGGLFRFFFAQPAHTEKRITGPKA